MKWILEHTEKLNRNIVYSSSHHLACFNSKRLTFFSIKNNRVINISHNWLGNVYLNQILFKFLIKMMRILIDFQSSMKTIKDDW